MRPDDKRLAPPSTSQLGRRQLRVPVEECDVWYLARLARTLAPERRQQLISFAHSLSLFDMLESSLDEEAR